ncbi:MAG: BREX-1 system phosphatase PglZ type A [Saccharospirillaceae bacterium]|nr:BREX-1 system phosphatase PglZ type A [Saccharospirillaceae bacterium]
MNIEQISEGLLAKFEKCRLVFWQDTDAEFTALLETLSLDNIEVIQLDKHSHFEVKQRIELLESESSFVLYSCKEPSEPTRDWLYDIRLYAQAFYADSSSMVLNELGMRMEFRPVVAQYKSFFTNKQRVSRLKKLLPANANKDELEISLIAATLKVERANFSDVLKVLVEKLSHDFDNTDLLADLAKYNLVKSFWYLAKNEMGYFIENQDGTEDTQPSLQELVTKLLFTDCYQSLQNSGVDASNEALRRFSSHLLPMLTEEQKSIGVVNTRLSYNSSKRATAVSFVSQWRESVKLVTSYNKIAKVVEQKFEVKDKLATLTHPSQLQEVDTFECAEQRLIILMSKQLVELEKSEIDSLVSHRLIAHWCRSDSNYACILNAIKAAKQFYTLKTKYIDGFNFSSAKELYQAYESELFQFDSAYRTFCHNANEVAQTGADILKLTGLVDEIESLYVNWYLHDLANAWDKLVTQDKLLDTWKMPAIGNQYDFYQREVRSILNEGPKNKVFVIISDALRYEVAHEINDKINDAKRLNSEIKSQLGVVPSYTQLGMGSLLPHDKMTAHIGSTIEYKADGNSVHGHENRQKILAKHNCLGFKYDEVLNWSKQEGRKNIESARVVYIYHNKIDAIGDDGALENQAFKACADAINEIKLLIEKVMNNFNVSRVLVTADHGFLYKSSNVEEKDKTTLKVKPSGAVVSKKRYVIGENLPTADYYWQGKIAPTANLAPSDCSPEFILPKGTNRFHFSGGAKFIHGGIMPQEICVPIVRVRLLKTDKQKIKLAKQKVGVVPLGGAIRLVSLTDKIQLLQTDAIGDKYKERELEIWIEDPDGNAVSSKQKVIFNSTSDKVDDRKRDIIISLMGTGFDRAKSYKLHLNDVEQKDIYDSHSVTIDLAIEDDFF